MPGGLYDTLLFFRMARMAAIEPRAMSAITRKAAIGVSSPVFGFEYPPDVYPPGVLLRFPVLSI